MDINAFFGLISMISIKKKAYVYERSVPCTLPTDKLSKKKTSPFKKKEGNSKWTNNLRRSLKRDFGNNILCRSSLKSEVIWD